MAFDSPVFIFLFLPVAVLLFLFMKKEAPAGFLLAISLCFYFWGEGAFLLLLLFSIPLNHLLAIWIRKRAALKKGRWPLWVGILLNLLPLVFFKYAHFLAGNFDQLLSLVGVRQLALPAIHLPLGISFYTFLALSLLIDSYRQPEAGHSSLIETGFYLSFFPAILAGPLNRFRPILAQLRQADWQINALIEGIRRFIIGLGKKVLIANTMAATANPIFAIPAENLTAGLAWLGIITFTLQIYFDFSGYTDMAIGLGRMFGFRFIENFNYPYVSRSVTEFWSRWHISLSSWLRDYIFLPVAYAVSRRIRNATLWRVKAESWSYGGGILVTMFLCGLWHGASWGFIVWGLWQGMLMLLERFRLRRLLKKGGPLLQHLYALLAIGIGWVFFRSASLSYAWGFIKALFGFGHGAGIAYAPALYTNVETLFWAAIGLAGSWPLLPRLKTCLNDLAASLSPKTTALVRTTRILVNGILLAAILLVSITTMAGGTHSPFIYFRF